MPVLSLGEYKKSEIKNIEGTDKTVPSVLKKIEKKKLYTFFHTSNPADKYLDNLKYYVFIDGKKKGLNINNGCVKTNDKRIADILESQGFMKIREQEESFNG